MSWGTRSKSGQILPVKNLKPEPVKLEQMATLEHNPALKDLQAAIHTAQASRQKAIPNELVGKVSVLDYTPPQEVIDSALRS